MAVHMSWQSTLEIPHTVLLLPALRETIVVITRIMLHHPLFLHVSSPSRLASLLSPSHLPRLALRPSFSTKASPLGPTMTTPTSRIRVYIACSLDNFISGPSDDLTWLPGATSASPNLSPTRKSDPGALSYSTFMKDIGAILMGRRTYDVVMTFARQSPYGGTPLLVATHRALPTKAPSVTSISGSIEEMIKTAKDVAAAEAADARDVYLDGGNLIRQALDADLVDDLVVTQIPVILGKGSPLFAGVEKRKWLRMVGCCQYEGMAQLRLVKDR